MAVPYLCDFFMEAEGKGICSENVRDWFQLFHFAQRKTFTLIERSAREYGGFRPRERDSHSGAEEVSVNGGEGRHGTQRTPHGMPGNRLRLPPEGSSSGVARLPLRLTAKGRHKGNCRLRTGSPTNRGT